MLGMEALKDGILDEMLERGREDEQKFSTCVGEVSWEANLDVDEDKIKDISKRATVGVYEVRGEEGENEEKLLED